MLAFHGSFRIHEETFDPPTSLQGKDERMIKTKIDGKEDDIIVVHSKSPKENALKLGVNIKIFRTSIAQMTPGISCRRSRRIAQKQQNQTSDIVVLELMRSTSFAS